MSSESSQWWTPREWVNSFRTGIISTPVITWTFYKPKFASGLTLSCWNKNGEIYILNKKIVQHLSSCILPLNLICGTFFSFSHLKNMQWPLAQLQDEMNSALTSYPFIYPKKALLSPEKRIIWWFGFKIMSLIISNSFSIAIGLSGTCF